MDRRSLIVSGLLVLIITSVLATGCTSSSAAPNQTQETGITTVTPANGPLFTAGDIVKNPKAASGNAWLIIGYDPATDTYERAFIYSNPDGSWGYRVDSRTEKATRSVMEKVYTEKITNMPVSSVPIQTQSSGVVTTVTVTTTPVTTTGSLVTTTATTATSSGKPAIKRIIPDKGDTGTSVQVSDLEGSNFVTGAAVKLVRSGSPAIVATDVKVLGPTVITCTLPIPTDALAGSWDLVVTNPDGQSATYTNLFDVHTVVSSVTTTVTPATGTIPITSIDPPFGIAHNNIPYLITGSKFQDGAIVRLHNSNKQPSDITGTSVVVQSATRIQCFFDIPANSLGFWDIIVTNPDTTTGTLVGGFEIRN